MTDRGYNPPDSSRCHVFSLGWPTESCPVLHVWITPSLPRVSPWCPSSSLGALKHKINIFIIWSYLKEQFTKIWKPCIIYSPSCCFKPMTLQGDTEWHPDSLSLTFCQTSYFVFHRSKKMVYKRNVQGFKNQRLERNCLKCECVWLCYWLTLQDITRKMPGRQQLWKNYIFVVIIMINWKQKVQCLFI